LRNFFSAFIILFLCSCNSAYREQAVFRNGEQANLILYAQSKNSEEGVLSLSSQTKLEYVLRGNPGSGRTAAAGSGFIDAYGDYSLEISYFLRGITAETRGQVVLDLGVLSWELPLNLSFLGISPFQAGNPGGDSMLINYAVPLTANPLERITISWVPEGSGTAGSGRSIFGGTKSAGNEPSLIIKNISLVKRRYGFSLSAANNSINLSPFVYYRDNTLVIDPPSALYSNGDLEIGLGVPGRIIVETARNPGYFRFEGEAHTITLPGNLLSPASFPIQISGAGIYRVELKESVYDAAPQNQVRQMVNLSTQIPEPIPADPGMILTWPAEAFRDRRFEIYRWADFPSILIFDFLDYKTQDRFLKRLAFYAEKAGFRGRLAADHEIANLHGWNAHDYRTETLAAFFNLAESTRFPLLPEEKELEALLFHTGLLLRDTGGSIVPGAGAIISISRESVDYLRSLFMAHEGFHALFFIDADFREFSRRRWEAFAPVPKAFILSYFDFQAYDINDNYLVINEFMGHILQQPVSQAARYFGETLAGRIEASERRRNVLPEKDESTETWPVLADAFTAEAEAFSNYVNQRWGLAAGRVHKASIRR